ncbi:MAG: O-antigen ligase family protein, partial [Candidatus Peregrinibacteria bacterium]
SEFVYLPEVLLVIIFGLWAYPRFKDLKSRLNQPLPKLLGLFLLNALLVTLWKGDFLLGVTFVWRVVEAGMLYFLIVDKILAPREAVRILLFGAVFQVLLSLFQWGLNQSVGLSIVGEPLIGSDVLNVAKIDLANGTKHIRPYGTFLHPNILVAYLLTILFIAFDYLKARQRLFWFLLFGLGVFLTHSLAGWGAVIVGLGLWAFFSFFQSHAVRRGIILALLAVLVLGGTWVFFNSHRVNLLTPSYAERLEQNVMGRAIFREYPFGVGVRNFTLKMEDFSEAKLKPWEFQPVHNTYFLILNETGIQGLVLLLIFLAFLFDKYWVGGRAIPLVVLVLLAPFDHFLWDSWAGLMLLALAASFFALHNKAPQP